MNAAELELQDLLKRVREAIPEHVDLSHREFQRIVRQAIDEYFNDVVGWSLLKDEWDHISVLDREKFITKVVQDLKGE